MTGRDVPGASDGPGVAPVLEVLRALADDRTLEDVLARVLQAAAELTGARWAALEVFADGRSPRSRLFLQYEAPTDRAAAAGVLLEEGGAVDLLAGRAEPVRVDDLTVHPGDCGLRDRHPRLRSFLGVAVRGGGREVGHLYVVHESRDAFTGADTDGLTALGTVASVAVATARLREEASRRQQWLEATARITADLVGVGSSRAALDLVAREACRTAGADAAWLAAVGPDGLRVEATAGLPMSAAELHDTPMEGSLSDRVVRSGVPISVDDIATEPGAIRFDHVPGWPTIGPAVVVPLRADADDVGALALGWTAEHLEEYRTLDPGLPASFAEQAALVLQVLRSRSAEQRVARLEDRDRIGRDLHDVVIQRLFATGLGLQSLARRLDGDAALRIEQAVEELDQTVRRIRRSIFGLGATAESDDLQSEVEGVVDRVARVLGFSPTLEVRGPLRSAVDEETGSQLLAVLGEALSNAVRHAGASRIDVRLDVADRVTLSVADDGGGIPAGVVESGLSNMVRRAEALGGECAVASSAHGTTVTWAVPRTRQQVEAEN